MSDFGDIELADVWDTEPTVDPLQLAMRLHRLVVEVDVLAGRTTVEWDRLDLDEQDEQIAVASEAIIFIRDREPDNPARLAELLHDTRDGRPWDDLNGDERQIAIDLMILILEWLEREGPR